MKRKNALAFVAALAAVTLAGTAEAKVKVVVTYPYIEALIRAVAKESVDVTVLAKGDEDPHFVVPRPSFIGKLRQADLLILNGGSLEIGFVPPLIRQASNPKINPGSPGFVELSRFVELLDRPQSVSRHEGDVHPEGNPHFILDWQNVPIVARAIAEVLQREDRAAAPEIQKNLEAFLAHWKEKSAALDKKGEGLKGKRVIQHHRLFNYLAKRTGLIIIGELEPKPGIPPTSRHLEELIEANPKGTVFKVITDAYHERKSAEGLAEKMGVPWAVLPHDVGAVPGAKDLDSFYDALLDTALK
jgi:zinc/manganese transport system substrate-binding protein